VEKDVVLIKQLIEIFALLFNLLSFIQIKINLIDSFYQINLSKAKIEFLFSLLSVDFHQQLQQRNPPLNKDFILH
jgi:hypothetical protein